MKYLKENYYYIIKMLLNQFGAAFLGLMLSAAASNGMRETNWALSLAGSSLAILLYMYLQYTVMWDLGARDIIRVDAKRAEYKPLTGLKMTMIANIPNALLALGYIFGTIFGAEDGAALKWAANIGAVCKTISIFWEAMYNGFVERFAPHNPYVLLLMLVPPLFAGGIGYFAGMKGFAPIGILGVKNKKDKK